MVHILQVGLGASWWVAHILVGQVMQNKTRFIHHYTELLPFKLFWRAAPKSKAWFEAAKWNSWYIPSFVSSEHADRGGVSQQHGCFQARSNHRGPRPFAAGVHRRIGLHIRRTDTHIHHSHPLGVLQGVRSKSPLIWDATSSNSRFLVFLTLFVLNSAQSLHPQFLLYQNCTATFRWETAAACAITTTKNNVSSAKLTIFSADLWCDFWKGPGEETFLFVSIELFCGGPQHRLRVQPPAPGQQDRIQDQREWERLSGNTEPGTPDGMFPRFVGFIFIYMSGN